MDEMKKTKISFNIVPITSSNWQDVINSIEKYFIQDEPLNASVELFKEVESVLKYRNFCTNLLHTGELINKFHIIEYYTIISHRNVNLI